MSGDAGVLHRDSFAKNAAAFFRFFRNLPSFAMREHLDLVVDAFGRLVCNG